MIDIYVRKAEHDDIEVIMNIYQIARKFMIESGNPNQWGHTHPKEELIKSDIENEICHVVCGDDGPHGVFALVRGDEPTYQYIENGKWLNDEEYVTIHRIAGDGKVKGIFKCIINYCKSVSDNIRIDTHYDNKIMQKLIERNDFKRCGRIYVADGTPRIAYQWLKFN